jgi:hypothetical protein
VSHTLEALNRLEEALTAIDQCLKINPHHEGARENKTILLAGR